MFENTRHTIGRDWVEITTTAYRTYSSGQWFSKLSRENHQKHTKRNEV